MLGIESRQHTEKFRYSVRVQQTEQARRVLSSVCIRQPRVCTTRYYASVLQCSIVTACHVTTGLLFVCIRSLGQKCIPGTFFVRVFSCSFWSGPPGVWRVSSFVSVYYAERSGIGQYSGPATDTGKVYRSGIYSE